MRVLLPKAKRQKIGSEKRSQQSSSGMLDILKDDDSLRSALLWATAADHAALRLTCRRFRDVINSDAYLQERCENDGLAEVTVLMKTPWERYKEENGGDDSDDESSCASTDTEFIESYNEFGLIGDYEDTNVEARIFVDGKSAGNFQVYLLPLRADNIHAMGDSISGELEEITKTFFNPLGFPTRVASVKEAHHNFMQNATYETDDFLYISKIDLKPCYQGKGGICSRAVRSLLLETPLRNHWSLAMYIPHGTAHMTQNQKDTIYREPTQELLDAFNEMTLFDMRCFLRAGFQQATETLYLVECFHVFCTPNWLEEEMMTEERSFSLPLRTRQSEKPVEMSRDAQELAMFLINQLTEIHNSLPSDDHSEEKRQRIIGQIQIRLQDAIRDFGAGIIIEGNLIHHCVSIASDISVLEMILGLLSEKDKAKAINSPDHNGNTPLMVAASTFGNRSTKDRTSISISMNTSITTSTRRFEICDLLLEHGADKNRANHPGVTALGKAWQSLRLEKDFWSACGILVPKDHGNRLFKRLERLLRPLDGPSEADLALADDYHVMDNSNYWDRFF